MSLKTFIILIIGVPLSWFLLSKVSNSITIDPSNISGANLVNTIPLIGTAGVMLFIIAGEKITEYMGWISFGNRLKKAYSAKFGGDNIEFDKEVDNHVNLMRTMGGDSTTKSIAKDWLKRTASFVEVPFKIPDEEYLSEKDKTIGLNDIDEDDD
jgi:hypothetical protein